MPSVCSKKGIWGDYDSLRFFKKPDLVYRFKKNSYSSSVEFGFRWLDRELAPEPLADWGKEDDLT